ncbi:zinc ribbon domain-containing protein [Archangium violaceum]|uniref:zinc ribbon domain-containing protein n=1 Tax=Archangium violaceum TaxID=83451 RepID=UPI0019501F35|nr:zinc ribbon domain-containing protein [Archangium violaceum]QRN97903.1 zinc ribbon domain-containing protein [Archangium violaceum]
MTARAMAGCERCGSALEVGDLRCPICGLAAAPRERGLLPAGEVAKVVRCDSCGASLEYSAEVKAPRCAFCASVMHVETTADPLEQAEHFLPFTVEPAAAREALMGFLSEKRFFRPANLAEEAALQSLRPMWWPAWAFSAGARVSWTADSNVGSGRSDWAPHSGQVALTFQDILVSASRGLTERECDRLAGHYALAGVEREPRGPEDAQVERFDVTRSGARRQILAAVEQEAREQVERSHVPGSRRRNVHVAVVLSSLETRRYALPAYVLAYRYRKKLYRVVVHGQDTKVVLGDAPVSVLKVVLVVAAVLLALLVVLLLLR